MFPAYGYKHIYPQVRAQMPADCRHHPASEGLAPQMKMGASPSPYQFETWPHYPVPTQCHSFCSHNSYPNYYPYRPPYPHFPSPTHHLQCYGGYPSYPVHPEPYPFQFAPAPHYTELPNYEYYKSLPRESHCCACYHHMPDMKRDKGVKIEEQESEAENREDYSVPSGFNNIRHPIAWIPPEYKKDQEHPSGAKPCQSVWNGWPPLDYESIRRMFEGGDGRRSQDQQSKHMEAADHQERPSVIMPQKDLKSAEQEPNFPRGWLPLDMDSLKKLLQNGNLKGDHDNQPMNQSHQMPFPVIWLPHNNKEEEASTASESSSRQRPVKPEQGDDHTQQSIPPVGAEAGEGGRKLLEKSDSLPKTIHVKQMDEHEPADMKTNCGQQAKNIEESKKSTEKGTKSKTPSPTKASKLPPVCLRVDPLPKKKNGQGKTRSPSPPGDKVQQVNAVKPSSTSENKVHEETKGQKNEAEKKSAEAPQRKKEINIVDMEDRPHSVEVVEKPSKHAEAQEAVGKKPEEHVKPEKRILSGTEAATIIQSAYRGYEVRRLEPLKKMRQIANIRGEAALVKRSIESGTNSMDLKQKAALGETIMNLLLKLDTIQGLHPSIRDFRKSVVKELVSLQEMLDTIEVKQPAQSPEDIGAVEATIQTPDEPSPSPRPVISEAEAVETEVQAADESSQNPSMEEALPGIGETEDEQTVVMQENAKDQISTSEELPAEEPSMEEALPGIGETEDEQRVVMQENAKDQISTSQELPAEEPSMEQALPGKESERDTVEKGATEVGEEAGCPLSDLHAQQNEVDGKDVAAVDNLAEKVEEHEPTGPELTPVVPEEASVEPMGQESVPVVSEVHVDSEDQADMKHDIAETIKAHEPIGQLSIPVVPEEASMELTVDSADQTDMKQDLDLLAEVPLSVTEEDVPNEGSDPHLIEPEKDINLTEPEGDMKVECPLVKPDIVHESDAKPAEDDRSTTLSSIGDKAAEENERMMLLLEKLIESEKQQQEIISTLNEKLKELEGKLAKQKQQKKKQSARTRRARVLLPRSCKPSNSFSKEAPMALAS